MTSAGFNISVEPQRALITATIKGHWDEVIVNKYKDELRSALERVAASRVDRPCVSILVDARQSGVQSQSVSNALRIFSLENQNIVWRVAIVSKSTLHKLQIQRGDPNLDRLYFTSTDEAIQWLSEPMAQISKIG